MVVSAPAFLNIITRISG